MPPNSPFKRPKADQENKPPETSPETTPPAVASQPSTEERKVRHQQTLARARKVQGLTEEDLRSPYTVEMLRPIKGRAYHIAKGPQNPTHKWWKRFFNVDPVVVTIEGTFEQVVGVSFVHPNANGHYLVKDFQQRRRDVGRGYPVHRDDHLYIVRIQGKRVVAHASELEEIPSK